MSDFRINEDITDPFVFTPDIRALLQAWAATAKIAVPPSEYFAEIGNRAASELRDIFPNVEVVSEAFIVDAFRAYGAGLTTPVVAIDRAYALPSFFGHGLYYLDITKAVSQDYETAGLYHYTRDPAVQKCEVKSFEDYMPAVPLPDKGKKVSLVDDVVFFAKTTLAIVDALRKRGVEVEEVFCGVSTSLAKKNLEAAGISLRSAINYDHLYNEVCGRDLIVGIPNGGRSMLASEPNGTETIVKVPFILPFGTTQWATIPDDRSVPFSKKMLDLSIDMWTYIETLNGRTISTDELRNPIRNLSANASIVASLKLAMQAIPALAA